MAVIDALFGLLSAGGAFVAVVCLRRAIRHNRRYRHLTGGAAMTGPVPPEDVRLRLRNGDRVPAECAYAGFEAGIHHWHIVSPDPTMYDVVGITFEVLPAHSSIGFPIRLQEPE